MLRPQRFDLEVDPGPVQIQPRKVHFDFSDSPLHWIPGHPVASDMIGVLHVVLPAGERWFVSTLNEALPLVKDPKLAEDIRGFIGQESIHADVHERALHEFLEAKGFDPKPMLDQVDYVFAKVLGPSTSSNPRRRHNNLCDRLWFIAALEHYTAVLGDFSLNNAWDDFGADPTFVDVFRWHGAEEVEHRNVAHDVATTSATATGIASGRCWSRRRSWPSRFSGSPGIWSSTIQKSTSGGGRCSGCATWTPKPGCFPVCGSYSAPTLLTT
jgi:predicted metal-dependent hydrolase